MSWSAPRLLVVGDALLDRDIDGTSTRLAPDAPVPVLDPDQESLRPGGAALAAVLAARDGSDVTLVTALDDEEPGDLLRWMLQHERITVVELPMRMSTAEKVRLRIGGRTVLRVDRGGQVEPGLAQPVAMELEGYDAVLVADYGRGVTALPAVRTALTALAARVPVVWDPHPLGTEPVAGTTVVTPNLAEAIRLAPGQRADRAVPELARAVLDRWPVDAVCLTRGEAGATVLRRGDELADEVGVTPMAGDPCGAGDRLASALTAALADGVELTAAVREATTIAARFVGEQDLANVAYTAEATADGLRPRAAMPRRAGKPNSLAEARSLVAAARAAGRRVVATGGCFDLLHAGHVALLDAAAALGDVLIVLVNDDDSIRRLKGPSRPLHGLDDRLRVLCALDPVDAAAPFEGDDPSAALDALRPDIWVKGGDYADRPLAEDAVLAACGARTVFVPLLEGRSTTRIVEEIACRTS